MIDSIILYVASGIIALWGMAHLCAIGGVIRGFGEISVDNKRIITMEWIVEGLALLMIAAFVATVTAIDPKSVISIRVYIVSILSLIALAVVSLFTGFKIAFLPFKLCPLIFGLSAVLIAIAILL